MFDRIDDAMDYAKKCGGAYIIQEKSRSDYEIVDEEESDYLVGFLETHKLVMIVK